MNYVVGVRTLCEFAAKRGDLDLRFTPSPTAQEGVAGHRVVAARRGAAYQAELALSGTWGPLVVRGRADGYDAAAQRLEEVKTHRGDLAKMPANHRALHWAQAKVYGALLCRHLGLERLSLALVYFDVGSQLETTWVEDHDAGDLQAFFGSLCGAFVGWAEQESAHAAARDAWLAGLRFPYAEFRLGQRPLAEAVYRGAVQGRCLLAQAPTGIGKTIGTLFPLLKAWPARRLDKIYFLTAKGSGRRLALDAVARLCRPSARPPLRTIELVARAKACEHPDKACHGESCPLARGFYDRLPAAREAALASAALLDQQALREVAARHAVCPYYMGQELVRWADVVVGDYNHYFDLHALLHGLALAHDWQIALLVDEAHNLIERSRSMYSATLSRSKLRALRRRAPAPLAAPLRRLARCWSELHREQATAYQTYAAVPARFTGALQQVLAAVAELLAESQAGIDAALLEFYFDGLHFSRLSESFGEHSIFDITLEPALSVRSATAPATRSDGVLCLRNVVPAPHLRPRFKAAASSVLFSATLTPMPFQRDMLGLPADAVWVDVDSPFAAEQLSIGVAAHVSTRYRDRDASLGAVVGLMAQQYEQLPGNYLAFFSSFEYLEKVAALVASAHPALPIWRQTRAMAGADREAFLRRFTEDGRGIAFAVLGGSFAEGIDLPGRRLIGAFVATLGLPPLNPVNETLRRQVEMLYGAGYEYTYLYPGIQKVVQAVGRVIRSTDDRGVVHLIDDRFESAAVRRLFPRWWRVDSGAAKASLPAQDLQGAGGSPAQPMQVRFLPVRLAS